jgi:predicted anti-sigma-YlaC factor YlaD
MTCQACRDAVSAQIDREDAGVPDAQLQAHLARCTDCSRWAERAAELARLTRLAPAPPVPDLSAQVLEARRAEPSRTVQLVRVGLVAVAALQLALGVPELFGQQHIGHEIASWNVAAAVGFFVVALRPRRVSGVLPVMSAAVAVLMAITLRDLLVGHVHLEAELAHLLLVAGVLLLVALRLRAEPDPRRTETLQARPERSSPAQRRAA